MRIGFDAKRLYHNFTGLGSYSRNLLRILNFYYPDNTYLLYNPKRKKVNKLENNINIQERLPNRFYWRLIPSIWRQNPIIFQLQKDKVALYHGLSGELPYGIHKTSIKTVVTIHDLIFQRYPELYTSFDRYIYYIKFRYAARYATQVVAISEQTKRDIIKYLKISEDKIKVIYQGCNDVYKQEYTAEQKQDVRKKYNLPEEFILNVGTIEVRKNILSVIRAITYIDIDIVIVGGQTSYMGEIKEHISKHNISHRIKFLSNIDLQDLAIIYQCSRLFVYPSIFEGFGIPIIEAAYSKIPVITSTDSCFTEAGGVDTTYVEAYDIQNLKIKIVELLTDEQKRKQQIENSYAYVQRFNDTSIAKNYHQMYQEILGE